MVEGTGLFRVDDMSLWIVRLCLTLSLTGELTVEVGVVLQLVSEERARDVDLFASDNSDLLAHEDLQISICPSLHAVVLISFPGCRPHDRPLDTSPFHLNCSRHLLVSRVLFRIS